ncbi:MAG TPA: hypothetical protein VEJ63_07405, partial [Planctomycetota bacterium]|nr:hypothetical protein [Planctomycetota bacterium]
YHVLEAPGKFVAGDDRRGRFNEWVKKKYESGVEVSGIMDNQGARLYVHHPGWTRLPESRGDALLKNASPLELSGMLDGPYRIEYWDARTGKIAETQEASAADGKLSFEMPARAREFGMKIDRREFVKPDLK